MTWPGRTGKTVPVGGDSGPHQGIAAVHDGDGGIGLFVFWAHLARINGPNGAARRGGRP